jgi:hypothetical protein
LSRKSRQNSSKPVTGCDDIAQQLADFDSIWPGEDDGH